jgi:hypothetical protein
MKPLMIAIYFGLLISMSTARADVQKGFRCSTTQAFIWPILGPHGEQLEHTVRVVMESYGTDDFTEMSAAQAAWKVCRDALGRQFDEDWRQFGFARAPLPIDEVGEQKQPRMCETRYKNPALYLCEEVTRQGNATDDLFVLVEKTILK